MIPSHEELLAGCRSTTSPMVLYLAKAELNGILIGNHLTQAASKRQILTWLNKSQLGNHPARQALGTAVNPALGTPTPMWRCRSTSDSSLLVCTPHVSSGAWLPGTQVGEPAGACLPGLGLAQSWLWWGSEEWSSGFQFCFSPSLSVSVSLYAFQKKELSK